MWRLSNVNPEKKKQICWNVQTGFLVYSTPAMTAVGDLVFGSGDGYLRMLGPDGTIYVSMDDPLLRAVSPTGMLLWTLRLGMTGGFSLAVGSDGLIYAAGEDATLYVVHPDGYLLTRFDGMSVLCEPVIGADGTVYVADGGGYVWVLTAALQAGDIYALHRPGDLNQDGIINLPDVAILCQNWLICNDPAGDSGCTGDAENVYFTQDIDRDYYVNPADLAALAAEWLQAD